MVRAGIPRALLYYEYYPAWQTFFEELGAEVVVSPPTTQVILVEGSSRVVTDTCLPVKVFCGHVLTLVNKCDYIFIPAIRSVKSKIYNCSKFLGFGVSEIKYHTSSFECKACPNLCEIARLSVNGKILAHWGVAVSSGNEVQAAHN